MIEIKNITKKYIINKSNSVTALNGVDLAFKEGEVIVIKGSSGSGKSTLLSLIAALSKPTTGEVVVDNKQISKLPDNFASIYRRDNIGFIFQKYNLIQGLNVVENISLPLIPLNLDSSEMQSKVEATMDMFHISHKKDIAVKNLSGGEQQRVAIARANVNNPKIILADEPTANLDEKLSLHFIEMIKELKSSNKTIVIATHDPLFFGLDFVDKEIELRNGAVV